jgi:hypothetical protein
MLYKALCERIYPLQYGRERVRLAAPFQGWRHMLHTQPRVRASTGMYCLKHSYVKNFTEGVFSDPGAGQVLECIYFRYSRGFFRLRFRVAVARCRAQVCRLCLFVCARGPAAARDGCTLRCRAAPGATRRQ